jgi:hypothetical protein
MSMKMSCLLCSKFGRNSHLLILMLVCPWMRLERNQGQIHCATNFVAMLALRHQRLPVSLLYEGRVQTLSDLPCLNSVRYETFNSTQRLTTIRKGCIPFRNGQSVYSHQQECLNRPQICILKTCCRIAKISGIAIKKLGVIYGICS